VRRASTFALLVFGVTAALPAVHTAARQTQPGLAAPPSSPHRWWPRRRGCQARRVAI